MADEKPNTETKANPAKESSIPVDPNAIIRKLQMAEETPHERMLKKHVPAWVISGAINLTIVTGSILAGYLFKKADAAPSDAVLTAVVDEKEKEEEQKDLTNPDMGLQSDLPAAIDNPIVADVNVQAPAKENEAVGVPDAPANAAESFTAPPGVGPIDLDKAGMTGLDGNVMAGVGGANGTMVNRGLIGRSGATRDKLVREGGGNDASEAAVAKGLIWLAKQQKANGSWTYDGSSRAEAVVATGNALLPFLAAGQTHKPGPGNKYQKVVDNALTFILANQLPSGQFKVSQPSHTMYGHAIVTIAICEAYGMTGDKSRLLPSAQKAINFIMQSQGSDGSWGYLPNSVGDTSIVGWQIQALKSAQLCKDMVVSKDVMDKARSFLDKIAGADSIKDKYGYSLANPGRPAAGTTMTSVGLLCRYYMDGWGPDNPGMASGVEGLMRNPPNPARMNMYYYYYATQVAHFHGGDKWHKEWNPKMRDMLINTQEKNGNNAGSWTGDNQLFGTNCGRLGITCMSLLTLEVYYRHLPTFKRGTGGLKELERAR